MALSGVLCDMRFSIAPRCRDLVHTFLFGVAHRSIIAIVRCQSHFPVSVMKSLPMLPVFAVAAT